MGGGSLQRIAVQLFHCHSHMMRQFFPCRLTVKLSVEQGKGIVIFLCKAAHPSGHAVHAADIVYYSPPHLDGGIGLKPNILFGHK